MTLRDKLTQGAKGKAILFCGAGFSFDCLNFSGEPLPTVHPLTQALNTILGKNFRDLGAAAGLYKRDRGILDYLGLIQRKFKVQHITSPIEEILAFPWSRIYTTNYDNVIEIGLAKIGKKHRSVTPRDRFHALPTDQLQIVHLHGFVDRLDLDNIESEIVLDTESQVANDVYRGEWGERLRLDFSEADAIVFVGYSLYDIEIPKLIRSSGALREKTYFINAPKADEELEYRQSLYGVPTPIGRDGLIEILPQAQIQAAATKRETFTSFELSRPYRSNPRTVLQSDLRDLFILGDTKQDLILQDLSSGTQSYTVERSMEDAATEMALLERSLVTLVGPLGHGKSILLSRIDAKLAFSHQRPSVFRVIRETGDFRSEFDYITENYLNCIFLFDDFFRFRRQWEFLSSPSRKSFSIVATSRFNIFQQRGNEIGEIFLEHKTKSFNLKDLTARERNAIVPLVNHLGLWGEHEGRSLDKKAKLIEEEFKNNFADLLVGLIRSDDIIERFRVELTKLRESSRVIFDAVHVAMYLEFIGIPVDDDLLRSAMGESPQSVISNQNLGVLWGVFFPADRNRGFKSSVLARFMLRTTLNMAETIVALQSAVINLSHLQDVSPDIRHAFQEALRFSFLRGVSTEHSHLKLFLEFYERLSGEPACQSNDLFWLQYAMCCMEMGDFKQGYQYLESSYGHASKKSNYDPFQTDNQMIRCLLESCSYDVVPVQPLKACLIRALELMERQDKVDRGLGSGQAYQWADALHDAVSIRQKELDQIERIAVQARIQRYLVLCKSRFGSSKEPSRSKIQNTINKCLMSISLLEGA